MNISELDVRINDVAGHRRRRASRLSGPTYHDVAQVCMMEVRCEAITFWGFTDAHTWLSGERPLLFDARYEPKPGCTTACSTPCWAASTELRAA